MSLEQRIKEFNKLNNSAIQPFGKIGWAKRVEVHGNFKTVGITESGGVVFFSVYPLFKANKGVQLPKKLLNKLLVLNSKRPLIKYALDEDGVMFLSVEVYSKNVDVEVLNKTIKLLTRELLDSELMLKEFLSPLLDQSGDEH